jgi:hypothetical protein
MGKITCIQKSTVAKMEIEFQICELAIQKNCNISVEYFAELILVYSQQTLFST